MMMMLDDYTCEKKHLRRDQSDDRQKDKDKEKDNDKNKDQLENPTQSVP